MGLGSSLLASAWLSLNWLRMAWLVWAWIGLDLVIISDYRTLTNLQIKQFSKYLDDPVIVDLKSNAFGNKVAVVDRHPEVTTSLEEHLDLLYYHRRKSWHLNKILDK